MRGTPTSVVNFTNTNVNKLNEGVPFAKGPCVPADFLGILKHVGKDLDVGKYRQEPAS